MLQLVILGVVQGLSEFLPLHSTAHDIFAEAWLRIARPGIGLNAIVQLGTAVAGVGR